MIHFTSFLGCIAVLLIGCLQTLFIYLIHKVVSAKMESIRSQDLLNYQNLIHNTHVWLEHMIEMYLAGLQELARFKSGGDTIQVDDDEEEDDEEEGEDREFPDQ